MPGHMSNYDPKDAVEHIVHDYLYLVAAGTDTQDTTLKHPLNHYAERTFLMHCRALADFFWSNGGKRDLRAEAFTKANFSVSLPTWKKVRKHINKHLMYLTVGRITNVIPWTGDLDKDLLEEFMAAWNKFLNALKPAFRPLFEEEIKRQRGDSRVIQSEQGNWLRSDAEVHPGKPSLQRAKCRGWNSCLEVKCQLMTELSPTGWKKLTGSSQSACCSTMMRIPTSVS